MHPLLCLLYTSQLGTIDISEGVIAKIAGVNATECFGVLGLAASDGWSDLLKKDSVDKGVRVQAMEDAKVRIEISLVVQYGVCLLYTSRCVSETDPDPSLGRSKG